jgi:hypothetical protein
MTILLTCFGIALLLVEGFLVTQWILRTRDRFLPSLLALPTASLTNVLLFFCLTALGIPLRAMTIWTAHAVVIALLFFFRKRHAVEHDAPRGEHILSLPPWSRWICTVLLSVSLLFGAAHALLLPSLHIDVFTNWAMRSQISFETEQMAFDLTETRGMAKPQYPFLIHALQIMGSVGQSTWNDRAANVMTWLMTISAMGAIFVMLKRRFGYDAALLVSTVLYQIPLIGIHLSQGYADLPLMLYCLLSWLTLYEYSARRDQKWITFSVLFLAAALWTKSEGLFVAFVPWAFMLVLLRGEFRWNWKQLIGWIVSGVALYVPFLIFLFVKDLNLTPHESDASLGIQWEGVAALPHAFFGAGSFGPFWMALLIAAIVLFRQNAQKKLLLFWGMWGIGSLAVVLFTYLFTPNVGFFLSGQSFYRQLFVPAGLLLFWVLLLWKHRSIPPAP